MQVKGEALNQDKRNPFKFVAIAAVIGIIVAIVAGMIFPEKAVVVGFTALGIVTIGISVIYAFYEAHQNKDKNIRR